jgi:hypothetical protein
MLTFPSSGLFQGAAGYGSSFVGPVSLQAHLSSPGPFVYQPPPHVGVNVSQLPVATPPGQQKHAPAAVAFIPRASVARNLFSSTNSNGVAPMEMDGAAVADEQLPPPSSGDSADARSAARSDREGLGSSRSEQSSVLPAFHNDLHLASTVTSQSQSSCSGASAASSADAAMAQPQAGSAIPWNCSLQYIWQLSRSLLPVGDVFSPHPAALLDDASVIAQHMLKPFQQVLLSHPDLEEHAATMSERRTPLDSVLPCTPVPAMLFSGAPLRSKHNGPIALLLADVAENKRGDKQVFDTLRGLTKALLDLDRETLCGSVIAGFAGEAEIADVYCKTSVCLPRCTAARSQLNAPADASLFVCAPVGLCNFSSPLRILNGASPLISAVSSKL